MWVCAPPLSSYSHAVSKDDDIANTIKMMPFLVKVRYRFFTGGGRK